MDKRLLCFCFSRLWAIALVLVAVTSFSGCDKRGSVREITHNSRDKVEDVKSKIHEFNEDDVLVHSTNSVYCSDQWLFIVDSKSRENIVKVFDPGSLQFVGEFARFGAGPNEIAIPGTLAIDKKRGKVYLFDHGKFKVAGYDVDSALADPDYQLKVMQRIDTSVFPSDFNYINDTLGVARRIKIVGDYRFVQSLCRYNLMTGEVTPFYDDSDRDDGCRSFVMVSPDGDFVVESYMTHDLVSIYDIDGTLKMNIKGPEYKDEMSKTTEYFIDSAIGDGYIFIRYSGLNSELEPYGKKVVVFKYDGTYVKTLDTGYRIVGIALNIPLRRLYFSFNDDIQFGYLDLDEVGL